MIEMQEFTDPHGRSPFQPWVEDLDARTAANVMLALTHTEQRNVSNVKGMGSGSLELQTDCGPGYRIYFRNTGGHVAILLDGWPQKRKTRKWAYGQAACLF
jgi:putative addiction module killer protein